MFSFFQDYLSLIVEYLSVLLEVNFPPVLGFQCKSLSKWDSVPLFLHPFPVCWFCCCLSPTLCPSLRTRSWLEVQAPVLVDVENNADVLPGLGAVCSLLLLQISGFITAVTPAAFMEAFQFLSTGRVCFVRLVWFSAMALNYLGPPARWLLPASGCLLVLVLLQASPCFWTGDLWLQPLLPARCCSVYLISLVLNLFCTILFL